MKRTIALLLVIAMCLSLAACGGGYKKKLIGSWYEAGEDEPQFIFYSDGTCKIRYEYGTGSWRLLDDNQLKVTNFYGETDSAKIVSIKDGMLTLNSGLVLYSKPQK